MKKKKYTPKEYLVMKINKQIADIGAYISIEHYSYKQLKEYFNPTPATLYESDSLTVTPTN